jgi:DNA polymerase-3 subunit delta
MILFLFGEDTYSSHQKLAQIKAKFIDASLGDTNLSVADCADKELDYTQITQMVLAMPFLAKTRLVVIKNLLSDGKKKLQEQFIELLDKVPDSTVLLIYESEKVDRRTALFKALTSSTSLRAGKTKTTKTTSEESLQAGGSPPQRCSIQAQEFKSLEPYELKKWIKYEVEKQGGTIDNLAIDKLIEYIGNDLWRLSNEIAKLISYCHSERSEETRDSSAKLPQNDIKVRDVELLVRARVVANVFDLIDAIGAKNIKKAQNELHKLTNSGQNELYIHTMIVYQFRNLLIVKDLLTNSKPASTVGGSETLNFKQIPNNKFEISKQSGLHPFVVEKTMGQAKNYTFERLKEIYQILLDYDIKMKTGQIELGLALDMLLIDLMG